MVADETNLAAGGVKVCHILSAGKNITVNADQNISIKELIANKDNAKRHGIVKNNSAFTSSVFDSNIKAGAVPLKQ